MQIILPFSQILIFWQNYREETEKHSICEQYQGRLHRKYELCLYISEYEINFLFTLHSEKKSILVEWLDFTTGL